MTPTVRLVIALAIILFVVGLAGTIVSSAPRTGCHRERWSVVCP